MSYYKALLLESEIYDFKMPSIPEYKMDEIDLEDSSNPRWYQKLFEMLKKMIQWCKEKLMKLGKFISEKLREWFKNKRISRLVNRIKDARNFGLLKDHNVNVLLIHALNPYLTRIKDKHIYQREYNKIINKIRKFSISTESRADIINAYNNAKYSTEGGGWWLLVNKQGEVRDIKNIIKNTMDVINYIKQPIVTYDDIKRKYSINDYKLEISETFNDSKRFSDLAQPYLIPYCLDGHPNEGLFNIDRDKFDVNSIYKLLDSFETQYQSVEISTQKLAKEINDYLKNIENQLKNNKIKEDNYSRYQSLLIELDKFHLLSSIVYVPIYYLINFTRLLDGLSHVLFSERYLTTTDAPASPIYHLSNNPDLGKGNHPLDKEARRMFVDFPLSGTHENLPPRISFSPSPELCCYGLGSIMPYVKGGGMESVKMYLYQGIQVKNKTRYIREEIVRCAISSDTHLSKEVCVTSDIDIKLIGEVEIRYNSGKRITEPDRYFIKLVKK